MSGRLDKALARAAEAARAGAQAQAEGGRSSSASPKSPKSAVERAAELVGLGGPSSGAGTDAELVEILASAIAPPALGGPGGGGPGGGGLGGGGLGGEGGSLEGSVDMSMVRWRTRAALHLCERQRGAGRAAPWGSREAAFSSFLPSQGTRQHDSFSRLSAAPPPPHFPCRRFRPRCRLGPHLAGWAAGGTGADPRVHPRPAAAGNASRTSTAAGL